MCLFDFDLFIFFGCNLQSTPSLPIDNLRLLQPFVHKKVYIYICMLCKFIRMKRICFAFTTPLPPPYVYERPDDLNIFSRSGKIKIDSWLSKLLKVKKSVSEDSFARINHLATQHTAQNTFYTQHTQTHTRNQTSARHAHTHTRSRIFIPRPPIVQSVPQSLFVAGFVWFLLLFWLYSCDCFVQSKRVFCVCLCACVWLWPQWECWINIYIYV